MKNAPFKARFRSAPVMPGLARLSGGSGLAAASVNPRVYANAPVATPSLVNVEGAPATELTFATSCGSISMRMSSAAPPDDGLSFHRVVPNFVV